MFRSPRSASHLAVVLLLALAAPALGAQQAPQKNRSRTGKRDVTPLFKKTSEDRR